MEIQNILVVDDEERITRSICLSLEREGFRTVEAHCGQDGIALYEQERFDLVFLDISMPGMDGYEVLEKILEIDKDALVVMVTGNASVKSAVKALKIGAWDYLKKPFEFADLIKTAKNAIAQKKLIEEKKAVSARLEISETKYRYLINNSPDLIFTLDTSGCITFANFQSKNILGLNRQELTGTFFRDIIYEKDIDKAETLITLCRNFEKNDKYTELHLRFKKTGKERVRDKIRDQLAYMELRATPVYFPAVPGRKEYKGLYVVARDVTDRINLEAQLHQSQKMEAIGVLAGGIAHDFNNILMGIQGYASLVKMQFDADSDGYRKLSCIDEYVKNGADMTRQLLNFSQHSSQETVSVKLNHLLKMSAKMFSRTKKDLNVELDLDSRLWPTVVDTGQIKQVLINLFVNAWQAMPDGGTIGIKSENIVASEACVENSDFEIPGPYVKITVSDTGVGMEKEVLDRIFEPFFTTKEVGKGTGLGLATAYGIVKSHKGVLSADSVPDKGSSFMIFLPAAAGCAAAKEVPQKKDKVYAGKGNVLLVDDEEKIRRVCSEMLLDLGFNVKTASDGFQAVKILETESERIDLVILDMVMPKMNGRKTCEKIRAYYPNLKVLVCSGYSTDDEIKDMLKLGCSEYLPKPFDIAALSEKISLVLDR